ncbi:hypothetical protein [Thermovirga sp.]|nr:hypothetical protein [Thermovirga sp.]MBO8154446.1 hypothetical protein [Thermovirga sp.]
MGRRRARQLGKPPAALLFYFSKTAPVLPEVTKCLYLSRKEQVVFVDAI